MRDRLIELLRKFQFECHKQPCSRWEAQPIKVTSTHMKMEVPDCDECKFGQIADYILADGWIRLPCKVGDKVYRISTKAYRMKYIQGTTVSRIAIDNDGIWFFCECNPISKCAFGKTIFLTKEEAEAALKGGAE